MVPERAGLIRVIEQVKRPDSPWNSVTPAKKLQGGVGVPDRRKVFRRPWTTWSPPSTWALSHMRNASAAAAGLPARCCLSTDEVRKLPDPILHVIGSSLRRDKAPFHAAAGSAARLQLRMP